MDFLFYDLGFLVLFGLFLIIFLYAKRRNLKREGILYLYKTKLGIKFIDYIGKKYKKIINFIQYFSIVLGYILMGGIFYILINAVYTYLRFPEITEFVKAPPLVPLIPYFPKIFGVESFFPPFYFTYFIIAVLIVAVVHEFSHGIFAKAKGLKIKSTGFAFLGPIVGAFVEPDEKRMMKKKKIDQMAILSAGVFANIITAIVFVFIAYLFLNLAFTQAGAVFTSYVASEISVADINSIDGYAIKNPNTENILNIIENKKIEPDLIIGSEGNKVNLTEMKTKDKTYLTNIEVLKAQLETKPESIVVYEDFPAIRAGLRGAIVEFNDVKIKNQQDLSKELINYKPGEKVIIKTESDDKILSYELKLAESPTNESKAFLGIGSKKSETFSFKRAIYNFFVNSLQDPSTNYKPKFNAGLAIFIRDLLWWVILINFFVALFNMLPAGFLDGGRFFYLTVLGIIKNENFAKKTSKFMIYLILLILFLMMVSWFLALI